MCISVCTLCHGGSDLRTHLFYIVVVGLLASRLDLVMAFSFSCMLSVEYRGMRSGVSLKTDKPWLSLLFEDMEQSQLNVSVPAEMIADVNNLQLRKGDMCAIKMRASARADGNSYLMLQDISIVDDDGVAF